MTLVVMDTNSYNIVLGLDFLIKIGTIMDVEWSIIQMQHGPSANVQVLPLIMVNMLHWLNSEPAINAINNNLENLKIIGTPFSL